MSSLLAWVAKTDDKERGNEKGGSFVVVFIKKHHITIVSYDRDCGRVSGI